MSSQITTAFVQQFNSNVSFLSQQMGSRLAPFVRQETQNGSVEYFDQVGSTDAKKKTNRHGDTPLMNTPHARRAVGLVDYEWADLIDKQDKVRTLIDPTNAYAMAAAMAMGRAKDDEIINAALGTSYTGVDGKTAIALPNSQRIVAVSGGAGANFIVQTLIQAKSLFGQADVPVDSVFHIACDQKEIDSLLGLTQVTSSDYNGVKALVEGKVDTFMGFQFHRLQRLPFQAGSLAFDTTTGQVGSGAGDANGYRRCFAWIQDGLLLSTGVGMSDFSRIDERADKSYSTQVYKAQSIGATRMEEVKVVEILAKP